MNYLRRMTLRFAGVLMLILAGSLLATSWIALQAFERAMLPEIESKAGTVARNLAGLIGRAASHDMALRELVGVGDLFADVERENPEVGLLVITDNAGAVLHHRGPLDAAAGAYLAGGAYPAAGSPGRLAGGHYMVSVPVLVRDNREGFLHVGARASFVQAVLQENLLDILVVLAVTFFIAVEIVYFFSGRSAATQVSNLLYTANGAAAGNFDRRVAPATLQMLGAVALAVNGRIAAVNDAYDRLLQRLRRMVAARHETGADAVRGALQRLRVLRSRYRFGAGAAEDAAARLGLVRAPLFLFLIAEDLSRSFIPVYSAALFTPVPGISVKFVLGLPIMLFMLVVALSQPVVGGWSERVGRRRALLAGALVGAFAHLAAAFAFTLYDLLIWRSMAGVAWGIVFVAGQGYVLDHTDSKTRTRGLAFFVGVIMTASVCGPSIGGILADGIGYRPTLLVSALLAALAAWLVHARLADDARPGAVSRKPRAAEFAALFANRRFVVFLATAAMPAKIILIAFCFYLIPLYMPEIGSNMAMAGRLIMLYAIVMVLGVPLAARWSGDPARRWQFVTAGLFLSGAAGLMPLALPGLFGVAAMVLLLGAAQSLSIAPQTAMVAQVCRAEVQRLGEGTVLGIYRLIERIGNALGPVAAAALLQGLSYGQTFAAIGLLMIGCGVVFGLTFRARVGAPPVVRPA